MPLSTNTTNPFTYTINPTVLGPLLPVPAFQTQAHTALLSPNVNLKETAPSRTFFPSSPPAPARSLFSLLLSQTVSRSSSTQLGFASSPRVAVAEVSKVQVQGVPSPPPMSVHLAHQWLLCPGNSCSLASEAHLSLSSLSYTPLPCPDQPRPMSVLSRAWSSISLSTFPLNLMHP